MTVAVVDLRSLRAKLEDSLKVFHDPQRAVLGSALAINAVCGHLMREGIEPRLLAPMVAAVSAIADDAQAGAGMHKGNEKPLYDAMKMAQAARFVDILLSVKRDQDAACKAVAEASGGAIDWRELKWFRKNGRRRWRSEARAINDGSAKDHFSALKALPPDLRWKEALSAIHRVWGKKA